MSDGKLGIAEIPRLVSSAEEKQEKTDGDAEWPEPDWSLLDDRRGTLPDFPLDVLTEPWRSMAAKIGARRRRHPRTCHGAADGDCVGLGWHGATRARLPLLV